MPNAVAHAALPTVRPMIAMRGLGRAISKLRCTTEHALLHGFTECATAQQTHGKSATESTYLKRQRYLELFGAIKDVQRCAQRCERQAKYSHRYTSKAETQHTKTSLTFSECRSSGDFGNILDALNRLNTQPP